MTGRSLPVPALIGILLATLAAARPAASQSLAVVSRGTDRVAFVDLETGELTLGPRVGQFPHEIAADDAGRAYVPAYGGTTVHVVDLSTGRTVAAWDFATAGALHGAAVSRDGSLVWVTAEEKRVVLELDARTGHVLRRWPTSGYRSHMVAATPDDRKLFVANLDDGTISVIDRDAGITSLIHIGGGPEGIDVSPSGDEVWVTNRDDGTVAVIDTRADEVVDHFAAGGRFPVKLRFSPDGRRVLVANNRSGSVSVFDADGRKLISTIPVGERPLGLAFSADSRFGYVTRPGADEVVEIDPRSRSVTRRLRTVPNPDGVLWMPATGRLRSRAGPAPITSFQFAQKSEVP